MCTKFDEIIEEQQPIMYITKHHRKYIHGPCHRYDVLGLETNKDIGYTFIVNVVSQPKSLYDIHTMFLSLHYHHVL